MCIDTVSLPNVSRYGDILIYCCISSIHTHTYTHTHTHTHARTRTQLLAFLFGSIDHRVKCAILLTSSTLTETILQCSPPNTLLHI